ncbi:Helix-turn-helix domain-containing protein [Chitinophaga eiseniae]|uniref:Helix-turn-helix domain-containing protein n=1 Tax=Chitinophaga eiseniae TaxID=634771 RepID=A0A1T4KK01_9BACT|nr:Helix-turn-helix domain-containing protein [Chitinophaga eiseniae]
MVLSVCLGIPYSATSINFRWKRRGNYCREGEQVSTVAYLLEYTSPNNFSTAFRKRFGVSPGKFKG